MSTYDAVVLGSGPNGLAAAITLARAGKRVVVYEGAATVGGGLRSAELTLPGFVHDVCSAVHPLAASSAFFRSVPLAEYGLEWIHPPAPLAHPFDDMPAAVLERSVLKTGHTLGVDDRAYWHLIGPVVHRWDQIAAGALAPLKFPPTNPLALALFGARALWPASTLANIWFHGPQARGLFGGMVGHAILPLEKMTTSAIGLVLAALGHAVGWPIPRGGSQRIADALAAYLRDLGGEIVTGHWIQDLRELPRAPIPMLDITPRQFLNLTSRHKKFALPSNYARRLKKYRYGPGAFKLDYALSGPVPWRDAACARAGTLHLGGTIEEIAASERDAWNGVHNPRPYVLVSQPSLFDPTRAPAGQHTLWAYAHVPHNSQVDVTDAIEAQIERFAPGFRKLILKRHVMNPQDIERYNPNYVGGDINGGAQDIWQLYTRPVAQVNPYATLLPGVYLCSSSTPPGGGVHGLGGFYAAQSALRG